MKQKIEEKHDVDEDRNPAGGVTSGTGIAIRWQNGPLGHPAPVTTVNVAAGSPDALGRAGSGGSTGRSEPNGAFVEGVIQAAIGRLQFYQKVAGGRFACRENAIAITKLEEALMWLEKRTADREARQVEGTHTP